MHLLKFVPQQDFQIIISLMFVHELPKNPIQKKFKENVNFRKLKNINDVMTNLTFVNSI